MTDERCKFGHKMELSSNENYYFCPICREHRDRDQDLLREALKRVEAGYPISPNQMSNDQLRKLDVERRKRRPGALPSHATPATGRVDLGQLCWNLASELDGRTFESWGDALLKAEVLIDILVEAGAINMRRLG